MSNHKDSFLILKEEVIINNIKNLNTQAPIPLFIIHLEVIKEVKGFTLGEKFTINRTSSILDILNNKEMALFDEIHTTRGYCISLDSFITMNDFRDKKLEEILL